MVEKKTTTKAAKSEADAAAPKVRKAAAPKADAKQGTPAGKYVYAVGRRKTAVAKVRLYDGTGSVTINGKALKDYMGSAPLQKAVTQPLAVIGAEKSYDIVIDARGGGLSAQSGAAAHGISRALLLGDETHRKILRSHGLLTRDSRMKERKKPGLRKARRAPQWSKR